MVSVVTPAESPFLIPLIIHWHCYTDIVQVIDEFPPTISIEGLRHESVEIERKFAKLMAGVYQSLISRNISKR